MKMKPPIDISFFSEPKISTLSKEAKLIAVYLTLYAHSKNNRSFYMPLQHLRLMLGLEIVSIPDDYSNEFTIDAEDALAELSDRGLVQYEDGDCITLASNWFDISDGD